jgi:hypothetical protein
MKTIRFYLGVPIIIPIFLFSALILEFVIGIRWLFKKGPLQLCKYLNYT